METEVDAAGDEETCNGCSNGLVAVERASIQGTIVAQMLDVVQVTADGTVEFSCTMPGLETDPRMSIYGYNSSKQKNKGNQRWEVIYVVANINQ